MSDKTPKLKEETLVKSVAKKASIKKTARKRPATKKTVTRSTTKNTSKKTPSPKTVKSKNVSTRKASTKKTAVNKTLQKNSPKANTSSNSNLNSTQVKNEPLVKKVEDKPKASKEENSNIFLEDTSDKALVANASTENNVLTSFLKPKDVSNVKHEFLKKTLDENVDLTVDYIKIKQSEEFLRQLDDSPWLNTQLKDLTLTNRNSSKLSNQASSKMKVTADVIDVTQLESKKKTDTDQVQISHFKPTKSEQLKTIAAKSEQDSSLNVSVESNQLNNDIVSIFASLSKTASFSKQKETEASAKNTNKNIKAENINQITKNTQPAKDTFSSKNKQSSDNTQPSEIKPSPITTVETHKKRSASTPVDISNEEKIVDSLADESGTIEQLSDSKSEVEQNIAPVVANENPNQTRSQTSNLDKVLEAQIEFLKNIQIPNESCAVNLKSNSNKTTNDVSGTIKVVNKSSKNTDALKQSLRQDDSKEFNNIELENHELESNDLENNIISEQAEHALNHVASSGLSDINNIKNNDVENSLTQSILNEGNSEIGIYTDQHIITNLTVADFDYQLTADESTTSESATSQSATSQSTTSQSTTSQSNQYIKEHNIVSGSSVEETKEEDQTTLDFQAALNAVNLKKPEKVKPTIDVDSIRSDLNKVQHIQNSASTASSNNIDTSTSSEPDNKSDNWYKMAAAYVSDKKDKIVTTLADSDDEVTEENKPLVYQDVKIEGLFGGVGNAIGNGFKNIGMIGVYTKIGLTEGAKDSKNVVSKLISKVKS